MLKLIFLDIDGVVGSIRSYDQALYNWYDTKNINDINKIYKQSIKDHQYVPNFSLFNWPFDNEAIEYLHKLVRYNSNLRFVISSTWRRNKSPQSLSKLFAYKGLYIPIIGITKSLGRRDTEILEYIETFKAKNEIFEYCVIDDEIFDLSNIDKTLIVQTNPNIGFTKNEYNKVIDILKLKDGD